MTLLVSATSSGVHAPWSSASVGDGSDSRRRTMSFLWASKVDDDFNEGEIERLWNMAAKLRAKAARLEAQQSQAVADATWEG
jgi:hypothetical protein